MRVAVMQPYLFPYLPYFQLMHAVDRFVLLDTVQHIRRGWMNRNCIRLENREHRFAIPLKSAPQATPIADIIFAANVKQVGRQIQNLLRHAYAKAPCWDSVEAVTGPIFERIMPNESFVDVAELGLRLIGAHVGIKTVIVRASQLCLPHTSTGQAYILEICEAQGADAYVNAIGGLELYRADDFRARGIELAFLESHITPYRQCGEGFLPNLSVIDALANLDEGGLGQRLGEYQLLRSA